MNRGPAGDPDRHARALSSRMVAPLSTANAQRSAWPAASRPPRAPPPGTRPTHFETVWTVDARLVRELAEACASLPRGRPADRESAPGSRSHWSRRSAQRSSCDSPPRSSTERSSELRLIRDRPAMRTAEIDENRDHRSWRLGSDSRRSAPPGRTRSRVFEAAGRPGGHPTRSGSTPPMRRITSTPASSSSTIATTPTSSVCPTRSASRGSRPR